MRKEFIKELTKNQIIFNIAIWLILLILLALPFGLPNSFGILVPIIPAVYIHFFLVKKFFKRKKYFLYILLTFATILSFGIFADEIYSSNYSIVILEESINPIGRPLHFINTYNQMGFNPFIGIIIATILSYLNKKQRSEIQEMKTQKTKAELELLKSQVNPHFFFNTLNTLFSMASVKGDEDTAEGISQLSGLMRYMIYDAKVDLISLDKEIEHINNFIELQKLRFSENDELDVKFEIFGETKIKTIPPMLFIPFIENAYKFGFSIKQKSEIFIQLNIIDGDLKFRLMNTINKKKVNETEHSGIGIDNVRKRLELLYPNNHQLKISENNDYFSVYLQLPI